MKTSKLSFDFTDKPLVVEMLRVYAAQAQMSQKAVVTEALEAFFAHKLENAFLASHAERTFADWDNEEDKIYDTL